MRRQSVMGSSKYEFSPEQFDIDIMENTKRAVRKKQLISEQIEAAIMSDPTRMNEIFGMYIEALRMIKDKYGL